MSILATLAESFAASTIRDEALALAPAFTAGLGGVYWLGAGGSLGVDALGRRDGGAHFDGWWKRFLGCESLLGVVVWL